MRRKPFFFLYYLDSILRLLTGMEKPLQILRIFLGTKPEGAEPIIRLRKSGLKFQVRGSMDVWSVKEALLDRYYEKGGYRVENGWNVIDIGAGIGEFTIFAAEKAGSVLAFEPFEASNRMLVKNLQLNHLENVQVFSEAVASHAGEIELDLSGGEPLQIVSREVGTVKNTSRQQVKTTTLEEILQKQAMQRCDLLKLDCEGAEYDILFGAPAAVLERVERIVMEYHDHVTAHSHDELREYLVKQGYQVEVFGNPVYREIGYLRAKRA